MEESIAAAMEMNKEKSMAFLKRASNLVAQGFMATQDGDE
jgi:hypothetical protein